jgi:hypothetical protein
VIAYVSGSNTQFSLLEFENVSKQAAGPTCGQTTSMQGTTLGQTSVLTSVQGTTTVSSQASVLTSVQGTTTVSSQASVLTSVQGTTTVAAFSSSSGQTSTSVSTIPSTSMSRPTSSAAFLTSSSAVCTVPPLPVQPLKCCSMQCCGNAGRKSLLFNISTDLPSFDCPSFSSQMVTSLGLSGDHRVCWLARGSTLATFEFSASDAAVVFFARPRLDASGTTLSNRSIIGSSRSSFCFLIRRFVVFHYWRGRWRRRFACPCNRHHRSVCASSTQSKCRRVDRLCSVEIKKNW